MDHVPTLAEIEAVKQKRRDVGGPLFALRQIDVPAWCDAMRAHVDQAIRAGEKACADLDETVLRLEAARSAAHQR